MVNLTQIAVLGLHLICDVVCPFAKRRQAMMSPATGDKDQDWRPVDNQTWSLDSSATSPRGSDASREAAWEPTNNGAHDADADGEEVEIQVDWYNMHEMARPAG
jgi:hypothetical protein